MFFVLRLLDFYYLRSTSACSFFGATSAVPCAYSIQVSLFVLDLIVSMAVIRRFENFEIASVSILCHVDNVSHRTKTKAKMMLLATVDARCRY